MLYRCDYLRQYFLFYFVECSGWSLAHTLWITLVRHFCIFVSSSFGFICATVQVEEIYLESVKIWSLSKLWSQPAWSLAPPVFPISGTLRFAFFARDCTLRVCLNLSVVKKRHTIFRLAKLSTPSLRLNPSYSVKVRRRSCQLCTPIV